MSTAAHRDPVVTSLVGRDAECAALAVALESRPPRMHLLRGAAGVGKSALAAAAAAATGRRVVEIIGVEALADLPLAALAPLAAAEAATSDPVAAVLDAVARIGADAGAVVLVVDDAPWLDDRSAALVYQLVRAYGTPAIATARDERPLPAPLARLEAEGLVLARTVDGLPVEAVSALVSALVGAPPAMDDAVRLRDRTDGNPLLLRELIADGQRAGGVRIVDGRASLDTDRPSLRLLDVLGADLTALDLESRSLVATVALAQPVSPGVLVAAGHDVDAILRARAAGMVVTDAATGRIRTAHPLIAEILAPSVSPARRREVASALAATGDPLDRATSVHVLVSAGLPAAGDDLAWAAGAAYAAGAPATAVRLAELALTSAGLPTGDAARATIVLGAARSALGDLDVADAVFAAARGIVAEPDDGALLAARHGEHLAYRRFDVAGAVEVADRALASLPPGPAAALAADADTWRAILRMGGESVGGRTLPPTDLAEEVDPALAVRAAMARIMTASMGGRRGAALESAAVIESVHRRLGAVEPLSGALFGLERYFGLLSAGDGAAALAFVTEQRGAATGPAIGIWTYTEAVHRMYSGHARRAEALAQLAEEQLRWWDGIGLLAAALALRALLLAQAGRVEAAIAAIAAMEPAQRDEPKAAMLLAECRAWLLAADGDLDRAAAIIDGAAAAAADGGYRLVAAITSATSIRLGRPDRAAALLTAIVDDVDDELGLYLALRDVALALRDRTPEQLAEPAGRLVAAGMAPTALDALALARELRPSAEVRRRLDLVAAIAAADVDAPLLSASPVARPLLTPRELEVACAAARRERSREIAERLGVSPRTVEHQLGSAYRKLGVRARDELREALHDAGLLDAEA